MGAIKVLLVEDSASDAFLIGEMLADVEGFSRDIQVAATLADAINFARSETFDVVLLDLGLPDSQGVGTFRDFRRSMPALPVLVLTGLNDSELGLLAIQNGAQDYLVKGEFTSELLSRAIRYAIERHRVARALAASEERFQLAVTGAAAGLWDWNPLTDDVFLAPRFKEILGYADNEFPDDIKAVRNAIHPEDRAKRESAVGAHIAQRKPYDLEYRALTKEGDYRWIHSRGQALWNDKGVAYRMVGWIMDISERKRIEEQLVDSRQQLRKLNIRAHTMLEAERTRIAREVHDELGQGLTAIKIDLHWMKSQLREQFTEQDIDITRRRLQDAERVADKSIDCMQNIARDLRPSALDYLGLSAAIRDEAKRFSARTGIEMVLDLTPGLQSLDNDISTSTFRILQELLTNVARHARANTVWVHLDEVGDTLIMDVKDDGVGMPSDAVNKDTSLGLLGIRERAGEHGGSVAFGSIAGKGTHAMVRIPIKEAGLEH